VTLKQIEDILIDMRWIYSI